MATRIYTSVGDKARKVKWIYVGVDGKARSVKKVYVGVNGKARLCWMRPGFRRYNSIENLSKLRRVSAATTVGDYALFGGGYYYNYNSGDGARYFSTVDAYNSSLTRTNAPDLREARHWIVATTVGNYALFGGGLPDGYGYSSTVDVYNSSLTRTTAKSLSLARCYFATTTVGNYALFGGGAYFGKSTNGETPTTSTVDAYNSSLTRTTVTSLSTSRYHLAATTVGNYALFGGGSQYDYYKSFLSTVDAYNTYLTRTTATSLSSARRGIAATTVGNYALFGGGVVQGIIHDDEDNSDYEGIIEQSVVDAYNSSLTRTNATGLSGPICDKVATTVCNYALFGGVYNHSTYSRMVDVYNSSLTRTTSTDSSNISGSLSATAIGNYALFYGDSMEKGKELSIEAWCEYKG